MSTTTAARPPEVLWPLQTITVEVVFPDRANHYGTLFAGNGLELLSRSAFVAATRACRVRWVMAGVSGGRFLSPVRTGELIEVQAEVRRRDHRTVEVITHGIAERLLTGECRPVLFAEFVLMAVDDDGRPLPTTEAEAEQA